MKKIPNATVVPVRLAEPMAEWLSKEATLNATSMNAEIRRCVRVVMDAQEKRERAAS